MQLPMCSKCKKNVAVVFITRMENNKTINEGLCLKCAQEMGIKPINDLMDKMGISPEDLDSIDMSDNMLFGGDMPNADPDELSDDDDDDETDEETDEDDENSENSEINPLENSPIFNNLFGNMPGRKLSPNDDGTSKHHKKSKKKKFLDTYAINLTQRAAENKFDAVVGREEELARVIQILNRRQKNNPCLIGEPGVGKTAIAEALAQRIQSGNVPYKLKDKEVYLLDLTALVAGTQFRGQFEGRIKSLVTEVKKLGNIILVIDEVHNLVGVGDSEGSMNAANILKPALSRGEIQVIGATTFAEYRKHIEKDSALERRFQPVIVNEPSVAETIDIIKGIRSYYEKFHGVTISDDIAKTAVVLSERYITDRFLPDKAIDLIDEACSAINLGNKNLSKAADIQKELDSIAKEQEKLAENPDDTGVYQRLAYLKSRKLQLDEQYDEIKDNLYIPLTEEDLARVIELWTKIPASRICAKEYEQLSGLPARLKSRIIGQDAAIDSLSAAIRRNRVGISPKNKPVSFIFVGPTGVGKTELVKQLASDLFSTPDSLIRLDMSEYMEKHSVSKIIGSPPGYVGYDEAGQLTEKIRRHPYSVILFDEIEKAHPDVLNILLQILDDGTITDAHGRRVNFENAVIIMTSNAGSDSKGSGTVGFGNSIGTQSKERSMKALSDIMRPEFLNRVDEIITFNHLSKEDFKKIAAILLNDLANSVSSKGINLTWNDDVLNYLTEKSFSVTFGARNLRRLIEKEIEDAIASLIIDNYSVTINNIAISVCDGKIKIDII